MKVKNKSLGVNAVLNAFKSALAILFPLMRLFQVLCKHKKLI